MKKSIKFIAVCLACIITVSCEENANELIMPNVNVNESIGKAQNYRVVKNVTKIEFEGHKYIVFNFNTENQGAHTTSAVVHDPACPCRKNVIYYTDSI